jgi:hypothetical protein
MNDSLGGHDVWDVWRTVVRIWPAIAALLHRHLADA